MSNGKSGGFSQVVEQNIPGKNSSATGGNVHEAETDGNADGDYEMKNES